MQNKVIEFMKKANQPIDAPDRESVAELAARLIAEEAIETINALGFDVVSKLGGKHQIVKLTMPDFGKKPVDIIETIDGLCDTIYVCNWAASALGVLLEPYYDEVCENNLLKVVDPKFDENGKVRKPKGHPKPKIEDIYYQSVHRYIRAPGQSTTADRTLDYINLTDHQYHNYVKEGKPEIYVSYCTGCVIIRYDDDDMEFTASDYTSAERLLTEHLEKL